MQLGMKALPLLAKQYTDVHQYLPDAHIHLLNAKLPLLLTEIVNKRIRIND
jgi:hypothetical protein